MIVLVLLHATLAVVVSSHVLLHKRDVRAAFGWIATSWFAPVLGPVLYVLFGVNRVERRARRIESRGHSRSTERDAPHSLAMPGLAQIGLRVSRSALSQNNAVTPFENGTETYPEMIAAMDAARRSIALASYIFRSDRIGYSVTDALVRAKERGVEVRVLIDSIGSGLASPVVRRLRREGIPVVRFTRDVRPWQITFLNLRNHKKLLIVDGRVAFVGGLNFSEDNDGERPITRDAHFRLEGPVVAQLVHSFASDLEFATREQITGTGWFPDPKPRGTHTLRCVSSGPDGTLGAIETLFAAAVCEARRSVRIVTPYFLPDRPLSAVLRLTATRGVRIDVVVPERSDHRLFQWAMAAHMRFARRDGIRFHLSPPPFDHSKLVSVDGEWCAFGSPNWDVRSLRLNFETLVEAHGTQSAALCDAIIDRRLERSRPVEPDDLDAARSIRLRDAAARLLLPYL